MECVWAAIFLAVCIILVAGFIIFLLRLFAISAETETSTCLESW